MDQEGGWSKVYVVLLSDLLLVTKVERDNYLTVLEEPVVLKDIIGIQWTCGHGELQLSELSDCTGRTYYTSGHH